MAEITTGSDGAEGVHTAQGTGHGEPFSPAAAPYAATSPYEPAGAAAAPRPAAETGGRRDRTALARGAGLLAAGLLVGALAVSAFDGGGSAAAATGAPTGAATGTTGTSGSQVPGTTGQAPASSAPCARSAAAA